MPHDVNGNLLAEGDEVLIRAKITLLDQGEDYCNVQLESVHGRRPDGASETFGAINTGVLEKVAPAVVRERTPGELRRAEKREKRATK